jgi:hypothetical protein
VSRRPTETISAAHIGTAWNKFDLHGLWAGEDDAKARWCAEALLAGRNDNVDAPSVHLDILARDGADSIEDDERFGRNPPHDLSYCLRVRKHA